MGAPTPDPFSDRQLRAIERLVDRIVAQRISQRLAAHEMHRDIRLAKTVQASSSYPTSGNTFWIRFLDCAFNPLSAGSSTLTQLERTAEGDTDDSADVLAREINGLYLPEGTLVFALWQRGMSGDPSSYGEWWISAVNPLKLLCRFTLGAALATSDASKSATITNQYGPGKDHSSTSITVHNLLTHTAGTYVFEGDSGDAGLAYYDIGSNWRILQMECP
jgi:hypothetical protein